MDVLKNASNPYMQSTEIAAGNAQLVVAEVLVSKLLRKVLGMQNRSFAYLTAVHAASLPLIGGLQAPFSKSVGYAGQPNMEIIQGAAATVPAVWAAEYIVNTSSVGFHVPKPSIRDALMTAASKMLTKPLIGVGNQTIFPAGIRDNFERAVALEREYNQASNLRMK